MGWVFSTPYMPPALILLSNLVVPLFYNNEASAGKTMQFGATAQENKKGVSWRKVENKNSM